MKKVLLVALCIAPTFLCGCSDPEPKTRVVHHYYHQSSGSTGTPVGESAESFQANQKADY